MNTFSEWMMGYAVLITIVNLGIQIYRSRYLSKKIDELDRRYLREGEGDTDLRRWLVNEERLREGRKPIS